MVLGSPSCFPLLSSGVAATWRPRRGFGTPGARLAVILRLFSPPTTDRSAGRAHARGRSASIGRAGRWAGCQSLSQQLYCALSCVCVRCWCCCLAVKLWCEMEPPGGRDSRFNLGYSMNLLSGEAPEMYNMRPGTSLQQLSPRHTMVSGQGRLKGDVCYEQPGQGMGLEACGVNDISEDYAGLQPKKSPPSNGKKTKGRVKIKMEYIENKLRRYTTFSKRKTGIMKKAYELSTLTGTQVMLLVASETGHVYTFATRKLQPMITSEAGKALIQTCLNSPDPPAGSASGDQRMSATGFEETELTYNISDEDSKDENMSGGESSDSSDGDGHEEESDAAYAPPTSKPSSTPPSPATTSQSAPATTTAPVTTSTPASTATTTSSSKTPQPPILSPLVYQTPQGMMYATPSNGGVIFSLAQTDPNAAHPQFITIPLSMVAANGQGELDLSKRK